MNSIILVNNMISIIMGIVFGCIFFYMCLHSVEIHGPNSAQIVNLIYILDNKKYILEPKIYPTFIR